MRFPVDANLGNLSFFAVEQMHALNLIAMYSAIVSLYLYLAISNLPLLEACFGSPV